MSSGSQGRIFPLKYFKHSRPSSLFFLRPTLTFHPQFFLGKPFLERPLAVAVESKDHVIFQEIVVGEAEQWQLGVTAASCAGNRLTLSLLGNDCLVETHLERNVSNGLPKNSALAFLLLLLLASDIQNYLC